MSRNPIARHNRHKQQIIPNKRKGLIQQALLTLTDDHEEHVKQHLRLSKWQWYCAMGLPETLDFIDA